MFSYHGRWPVAVAIRAAATDEGMRQRAAGIVQRRIGLSLPAAGRVPVGLSVTDQDELRAHSPGLL